MTTTETTAAPTGLRAAKREQAAARKAAKPATRRGASAAPKAPGKAAEAAKKTAGKPAVSAGTAPKLRWQYDRETKMTTGQVAQFGEGELALLPADGKWRAVYRVGESETLLAEGSFGKAYNAAVKRSKEAA